MRSKAQGRRSKVVRTTMGRLLREAGYSPAEIRRSWSGLGLSRRAQGLLLRQVMVVTR